MDDAAIKARLEGVLESIFCPIAGCWPLHGCHYEFYYDNDAEAFVLEAWPVALDGENHFEPAAIEGNRHSSENDVMYELAEFDFTELGKQLPLESFHFSQWRSLFEIAWQEGGRQMELRVHILPMDVDQD